MSHKQKITTMLRSKYFYKWIFLILTIILIFTFAHYQFSTIVEALKGKNNQEFISNFLTYRLSKTVIYLSLILISYHLIDRKLK